MGEDDKAKLAAAKKRVEELKKKNKKGKKGASAKKEEKEAAETVAAIEAETEAAAEAEAETEADAPESKDDKDNEAAAPPVAEKPDDAVEAEADAGANAAPTSPSQTHASLAQQSKMRSASFRQGSISTGGGPMSPGPFSPDGETATDIYRKHVARIEELEKENKRLAKDATDNEKRWQKAEEELADLRENDDQGTAKDGGSDGEVEKLKSEIATLERQNSQLQSQVSRSGATRHGSSPSVSAGTASELEARVASQSATIETMELEISKLRTTLDKSSTEHDKQVPALEEKLARESSAREKAQRELADLRRNLERTSEKAVREGSERTSAETKLRSLEHELAEAIDARLEAEKKADGLEKKVATLTTLHKEQDSRTQGLRKDKERAEAEARELRTKVESLESENARLKSRKSAESGGGGLDDEGVDELENEERLRLERRVRELEGENYDLRRGMWQDKRREMQGGPQDVTSPGGGFQDVDLGASSPMAGRKHSNHHHGGGGGFGDFFQSGINALTGGHNQNEDEGFLDDDDMDFDEDAFRRAQEDDAKARLERIKEVKRGLKNWEGWRLDLVEQRRGGQTGLGEVFEV